MTLLSFSREIPDPVTGKKKKSNFRKSICGNGEFVKNTTFRSGHKWKVGDIIHFWDMSPRTKGKVSPDPEPFNPPSNLVRNWSWQGANIESSKSFDDPEWTPPINMYLPEVSAIDEFVLEMKCFSNTWVVMELYFAGIGFHLNWDTVDRDIFHIEGDNLQIPLGQICMNDGFQSLRDFFFFFWSRKKFKPYKMEGQILHWSHQRNYKDLIASSYSLKDLI